MHYIANLAANQEYIKWEFPEFWLGKCIQEIKAQLKLRFLLLSNHGNPGFIREQQVI
jgi:hypothetical protein